MPLSRPNFIRATGIRQRAEEAAPCASDWLTNYDFQVFILSTKDKPGDIRFKDGHLCSDHRQSGNCGDEIRRRRLLRKLGDGLRGNSLGRGYRQWSTDAPRRLQKPKAGRLRASVRARAGTLLLDTDQIGRAHV